MKTHFTIFAIIALFFAGTYSSIGQDDAKKQEEYAIKKRQLAKNQNEEALNAKINKADMTPEMTAKKQTLHLQQLLNLDEIQTLRVHEICTSIENAMTNIPTNIEEKKRMKLISDLETVKNEKLKEALTADQFKMYQNSFNKER